MVKNPQRKSILAPMSPLFARASDVTKRVSLKEISFHGHINLRGTASDKNFRDIVEEVVGCELPNIPNTYNKAAAHECLWLAPDEWLVVVPNNHRQQIYEAFLQRLSGIHSSVTDVSAYRSVIELAGSAAREILAKGCTIDFHPSVFPNNGCVQTLLARSQILIQLVDVETPIYKLFVRVSFARYVASWLLDALSEYELAPA